MDFKLKEVSGRVCNICNEYTNLPNRAFEYEFNFSYKGHPQDGVICAICVTLIGEKIKAYNNCHCCLGAGFHLDERCTKSSRNKCEMCKGLGKIEDEEIGDELK